MKPILCKIGLHCADKEHFAYVIKRRSGRKAYHRNYFFCKRCGKRITPFAWRISKSARKIKHTPDVEKMREFHKLGLGKGMSERSIFWTCSNCEMWTSLAHKFCPNCGAKFETEQALKEREGE